MKTFAIIESNIVTNVAISETSLASNWVDITTITPQPNIGDGYANGLFTAAAIVPAVIEVVRQITKLAYMNRFTDAELAGLYTAAKTVVGVEIWLKKFELAAGIDLDDPLTIGGIAALVSLTLLTAERGTAILA